MPETKFFTRAPNRGEIRIIGADRHDFLQGLITNDIGKLQNEKLLYACLLTPQGKFLHDFFIREENDALLLDCEGGQRTADLARRLSMYKLRANINIESNENAVVYLYDKGEKYHDPRHEALGFRHYGKPDNGQDETPFENWDRLRMSLCIPDGSRDLTPEKSTMDEAHMDKIGAIDYKKGCYIGQELTARMHYRGLGKKHLSVIDPRNLPEHAALRSHYDDIGLALVRD